MKGVITHTESFFQTLKKTRVQFSSRSVEVHKTWDHLRHHLGCFGSQGTGDPTIMFNKSTCYL